MRKRVLIGLLAVLGLWLPGAQMIFAADGDAGQAGAFLTYGAGARAMGMGRAFVGLADDATAVYWNPGGLANVAQNQVILQHTTLIDSNAYDYVGYDQIFPTIGTLGVGLVMLNQPEAEFRDSYDVVGSSFKNQEIGFLIGFGTDITTSLAAGATLKVVSQTLMGSSGAGFGLDVGLMYHPYPMLNIGLAFQNLVAPQIKLKDDAEHYPLNLVFGVGSKFFGDTLKVDLDVSKSSEQNSLKPRLGLEDSPIPDLFLRAGIDDTEIGLGAGYRYAGFQLDYALGLQAVEMMHKIALSYYFGGFELKAIADPPSFSPVGVNKVTVIKLSCQTKFEIRFWDVQIRNETNAVVKKYSGEGFPPDHLIWDGLLDNTNPMPDGKYKVQLTVVDANGQTKHSSEFSVAVQSLLPLGVSPVELTE
ncbi:MAG: PorV/PorQ family protein [Candidatus Firestonebacteria bacterium]|nr:PorV/PorQ family protein [Candidatus Firestonebacteria bacterium]